jgi:hypothetical protein
MTIKLQNIYNKISTHNLPTIKTQPHNNILFKPLGYQHLEHDGTTSYVINNHMIGGR